MEDQTKTPDKVTAAHYWERAFIAYMDEPEIEPRTWRPKHFEQVAFKRWLDAGDIENYPHALGERLRRLRDDLTARMRADISGWQDALDLPAPLALPLTSEAAG